VSINDKSFKDLTKVISFWEETYGEKFKGYATPYKDRQIFDNLADFYSAIALFFGSTDETVGCDLGCWLGFPAYLEAAAFNGKVYGIEIQKSFTDTAREWADVIDAKNVNFHYMQNGTIPLETGSVDWILINQVLCNALSDTFENTVREAARILKPGGSLIICDSNNPYHEPVRQRLHDAYLLAEQGNGTPDAPNGYNFRSRKNFIKQLDSNLSETDADMLAKGTCYLSNDDIKEAVVNFTSNGTKPTRQFDINSDFVPCNPINGAALGNPTNPYTLARIAESFGLTTTINTSMTRVPMAPDNLYKALQNAGSFFVIADKPLI